LLIGGDKDYVRNLSFLWSVLSTFSCVI